MYQLVIKVFNIIDARCNHEQNITLYYYITQRNVQDENIKWFSLKTALCVCWHSPNKNNKVRGKIHPITGHEGPGVE